MSEPNIIRRSLNSRQTGRTDWNKVDSQTDAEINEQVAQNPDAAPILTDEWLAQAEIVQPNKKLISIRLDADVLGYFQQDGKNYQTRINQVLRTYIEARKKSA